MRCLHCGGCCETMSPKSAPFPCPFLLHWEDYYFCRCYARRPQLCRDFDFKEFAYCPYGMNKLQLSYPDDEAQLRERVERGKALLAWLASRHV